MEERIDEELEHSEQLHPEVTLDLNTNTATVVTVEAAKI